MVQAIPLRLAPVLSYVASGIATATLVAAFLWYRLPYQAMERVTPAERFWVWEGVLWMAGLALTSVSVAVLIEVRHGFQPGRRLAGIPAAHWVMMSFGVGLIVVAAIARLLIAG